MKMLRWIHGKFRKYHIRNVAIVENTHIKPTHTFLTMKILPSFGHVLWRDDDSVATSVQSTRNRRKGEKL